MKTKNRNPICCFCGKECETKYGNNPRPVNNEEGARCCDECDNDVVIPVRAKMAAKDAKK